MILCLSLPLDDARLPVTPAWRLSYPPFRMLTTISPHPLPDNASMPNFATLSTPSSFLPFYFPRPKQNGANLQRAPAKLNRLISVNGFLITTTYACLTSIAPSSATSWSSFGFWQWRFTRDRWYNRHKTQASVSAGWGGGEDGELKCSHRDKVGWGKAGMSVDLSWPEIWAMRH